MVTMGLSSSGFHKTIGGLLLLLVSATLRFAGAFVERVPCRSSGTVLFDNVGPPNPDASPGPFHTPSLRSSYPPDTPPGLRGEAVRSALVTTERCIGWNLSTNRETSMGGVLEIEGRGTLSFLNGKVTRDFSAEDNACYFEGCLLDAKGRLIDVLRVTTLNENRRALVLTSPGHSSAELLKRLDPYIFPMDEVSLKNYGFEENTSFAFTLASTQYAHVHKVMKEQSKFLSLGANNENMVFPGSSQGVVWKPSDDVQVLVVPSTGLPSVACVGYTFVFLGSSKEAALLGQKVWEHLIGEENMEGPIEVGALEYETLRIEAGQPAFGREFGIDRAKERAAAASKENGDDDGDDKPTRQRKQAASKSSIIKTGPFDLYLNSLIDLDKGCYLGQEGVASVLKNPRGAPRTLYTVVFEDDFNTYESQSRGDNSDFDNLTTLPRPGQTLYALGSNEELSVGTIVSMGEAGGTGSRYTVGLAMIKRADSIRKKMKELDLEIERDADNFLDVDFSSGSGIIQPPPMDPLDGLEVIVEGTFTMGVLKGIPARQSGIRTNSNMFDPEIEVEGIEEQTPGIVSNAPTGVQISYDKTDDDETDNDDSLEAIEAEMAKAVAEAESAAAEAKRKADKMEELKRRAEEAMARRKQKAENKAKEEEDAAEAEAQRKAEKMAMLKQRAEEAMARRKQNKAEQ